MTRTILVAAVLLLAATAAARADAKADAIAACAAYLKKTDGVPTAVSSRFHASGSGARITVDGTASYQGRDGVRVTCKTNEGRVTSVVWG